MALGAKNGCDSCVHPFVCRAYNFALNSSNGFEVIGHQLQIHDSEHSVNKRSKAPSAGAVIAVSFHHLHLDRLDASLSCSNDSNP